MLFSSMIFLWLFLPITFLGSKIVGKKYVNFLLLIASLIFYAWGEPIYVLLMLCSILINWLSGLLIVKNLKYRSLILFFNVIINLFLLGYFKYAGMFVRTWNSIIKIVRIPEPEIALPIGISFFTFQALSYVVDVYRGEVKAQKNILNLALYISFFPQLIAGPIVKYREIEKQIDNREINMSKTAEGVRRFIYGLSKKVLVSNILAKSAGLIFAMPLEEVTGVMAWIASVLYLFQIYYDFSGYSDMAIGLGKMFGFEFSENFNYPYMSLSIREFWRRWHISLSTWFREYVYIPLGGNKKGQKRTYINLMIVFFLTGLWHGASYNFIFWGLFHGFFSILERLGLEKFLKKNKVIAFVYTFLVVNVGWIFFRVENIGMAFRYIGRMVFPWRYIDSSISIWEVVDAHTFFILICADIGMGGLQYLARKKNKLETWRFSIFEVIYCLGIFVFSIAALASNTYNPFIYFRF